MSTTIQHSTLPPWTFDSRHLWVDTATFAKLYRKSQRRIQKMCATGDIIVFGVVTYRDPLGHWYLRLPDALPVTKVCSNSSFPTNT